MMDAAFRFRRLLEVPTFARFCERVCEQATDFTRCSMPFGIPLGPSALSAGCTKPGLRVLLRQP
jgi:hypothetical protein